MKKDLHLTASVDKPEVLENIIERLATRRYDMGYSNAAVPAAWKAIETSSVETYLSGRIEFDYNDCNVSGSHISPVFYSVASRRRIMSMS